MGKLVVSLTYAKDNTDKPSVAFNIANAGIVSNLETIVFLSSEAVYLADQGYADDIHEAGFKPLKELIDSFIDNGGSSGSAHRASRSVASPKRTLSRMRRSSEGRKWSKRWQRAQPVYPISTAALTALFAGRDGWIA